MTHAVEIKPSDYLTYNPLLKCDLSTEISFHKKQKLKNDILAVISLVAFFAISVTAIALAAFFSPGYLPVVIGMIGLGLNVVHHLFFHPCKTEATKHSEALSMEQRVAEQIKILDSKGKDRLNPIHARYSVLREDCDKALQEITDIFHSKAEFSDKGDPENYQALKKSSNSRGNHPNTYFKFKAEIKKFRASKSNLLDTYLELRVHQIFLAYAGSNLLRTGTYKEIGGCSPSAARDDKDDIFFMFNPATKGISRKLLLQAHKDMAAYIFTNRESPPLDIFSKPQWKQINSILQKLPAETKPESLYRNLELAPFIEHAVNKKFITMFADYDNTSLRAVLSRMLLNGKYEANDIFPNGSNTFLISEIDEAARIAQAIMADDPDRETLFRRNAKIKKIVEAKIATLRIR